MKFNRFFAASLSIVSFLFIASCGDSSGERSSEAQSTATESTEEPLKVLAYDPDNTKIEWTAYKFTEKVGVSGTFPKFEINNTVDSENVSEIFENATFTILTESINSGDEGRDYKILEYFFGNMEATEEITGKVIEIHEDGNITFEMIMNGQSSKVAGMFRFDPSDNYLELSAELDVTSWDAGGPLGELNKICEELHKGEDGKSVLWPNVAIKLATSLSNIR